MKKHLIKEVFLKYQNFENRIILHKVTGRKILIIKFQIFKNKETDEDSIFCSFFNNGLLSTDTINNIF